MQTYTIIACVDIKGGISKDGVIPWQIQEDSNYFLDTIRYNRTNNKNVLIMGYNTYINCCNIKDCIFIIITSKTFDVPENHHIVRSVDESILFVSTHYQDNNIFICGGSKIYNEFYNKHDKVNIKENINIINKDYSCDNFIEKTILLDNKLIIPVIDKKNNENVLMYTDFNMFDKNHDEYNYKNLILNILFDGEKRMTRNAIVYSVFGRMLRFNLNKFPLLTTKKMFFTGIFEELMFFIRGKTDSTELLKKGVKIWEGNTSREFLDKMGFIDRQVGDMGPMYGYQLRYFNKSYKDDNPQTSSFDQLEYCLNLLRNDPTSRRIIMTTYNPAQAFDGVLFPCHGICIMLNTHLIKENKYKLNLMMTQRSCDYFLGVPFNIASYALLVYIICDKINNEENRKYEYIPGELIINLGDTHIYEEHKAQAIRQFLRESYDFPTLTFINHPKNIEDYKIEDIMISDYKCHPGIIAKMIA
jgi:thymidylate synthase